MNDEEKLIKGMEQVFDECKIKAIEALKKPHNTAQPWNDFTPEWLMYGLTEEIDEWKKNYDSKELVDIINYAVFVRLATIIQNGEKCIKE